MIAQLTGQVASLGLDRVVLTVGGVGLLVHTTARVGAQTRTGTELTLLTSLVVREDSLTLYGFTDVHERDLFDQVQTVSGVGPRLALAMLNVCTSEELTQALAQGDIASLTKVPGIGKKGAERLVLELKDKVVHTGSVTTPGVASTPATGWRADVTEALIGLGWNQRQAEQAVDAVAPSLGSSPSAGEALRAALQELGR